MDPSYPSKKDENKSKERMCQYAHKQDQKHLLLNGFPLRGLQSISCFNSHPDTLKLNHLDFPLGVIYLIFCSGYDIIGRFVLSRNPWLNLFNLNDIYWSPSTVELNLSSSPRHLKITFIEWPENKNIHKISNFLMLQCWLRTQLSIKDILK